MTPLLAIILPLKGRPSLTLRFRFRANEVQPPLCDILEYARERGTFGRRCITARVRG
jgi:hypothetical protein